MRRGCDEMYLSEKLKEREGDLGENEWTEFGS
jgi:hypothetical protein